ncbi:uncharacterized protein LOC130653769 [Hydractinia symbiolongicarpus]|uniref:uncharacterized protein LOC130653769 n=1 Tax=Hydractinia symbiolongicarpus TaxID=13093 RepID=UPI00254F9403|nr:uncharacterized protein LOC130653769 [Hydractinia symbiolongicarpus]
MLKNIKLPTTKRNIMHFLASIYDPLGIINPIVVTIKVLFQDLCVAKFDWDQPLEGEFLQRWNEICTSFDTETLNIDRLYAYKDENDQFENIELHGFSDGSKIAYGCCVYIRFTYKSGKVKTALLSSKSRIKPLTNTTIPRIELLGTLVLARLMDVLKKELLNVYNIDNIFYWTDSTIAYSWIKNDNKDYKTFVQNRLEEIRKLTASGKWCLVPLKDNPADIVSRGCSPSELNSLWFSGPTFLTLHETHWPHLKPGDKFISDDMTKEEVRKEEKVQTLNNELKNITVSENLSIISTDTVSENVCDNVMSSTTPVSDEVYDTVCDVSTANENVSDSVNTNFPIIPGIRNIIDIKKYSSFDKLVHVTAYVMRFISNVKKKKEDRKNFNYKRLSAEEIGHARLVIIKDAQEDVKRHKKFKHWEKNLDLFEDTDFLLRCRGRLGNAPVPYNSRYPILLVPDSYLTKLIIRHVHESVKHYGTKITLTELRREFWIPSGRNVVRNFIRTCQKCRRYENKPYPYPDPPSLPKSRLQDNMSFEVVGIDYAGPLFVKNVFNEEPDMYKAWIVLITCASTRAIHLDLASNSSGPECIEVLKRFIARKGAPNFILSDNGKCFISEDVQNFAASKNINWKFNIESAPWQGGFFERLVKSVKRPLKPLTYIYEELNEEPLTPNHLMYGRKLNTKADENNLIPEDLSADMSVKRKENVNRLLTHFWNRWRDEYVTELREFHKLKNSRFNKCLIPNVDDVVVVADDRMPRSQWRIGRIKETLKGKDGKKRAAIVQCKTDQDRRSNLRRPINKLIPFEQCIIPNDESTEPAIQFIDEQSVTQNDQLAESKITFVDEKDLEIENI